MSTLALLNKQHSTKLRDKLTARCKALNVDINKSGYYLSKEVACLSNGSFHRTTGRKKMPFAVYRLGEFHGFTAFLPDDYTLALPYKLAKQYLPECNR